MRAVSQLFAYSFPKPNRLLLPRHFPPYSNWDHRFLPLLPSITHHSSRTRVPMAKGEERERRGKAEKLLRSQKPISMTDCLARLTHLSGRTADYAHSQQEFGSSRSHAISYLAVAVAACRPWLEQETLVWETNLREIHYCMCAYSRNKNVYTL